MTLVMTIFLWMDCLSLNYQPVHGVPGFEIETADDTFRAPITHHTRARVQLKSTDTYC